MIEHSPELLPACEEGRKNHETYRRNECNEVVVMILKLAEEKQEITNSAKGEKECRNGQE
jgi:hypothetical protein